MTLISFPPISWYLFSLSIPRMEIPTSKEPLLKPDTIYYSLASSAIGGKVMSIQEVWRDLDEEHGVVVPSNCVVKGI